MKKTVSIMIALLLALCMLSEASALTISSENEFPIVDDKITLRVWGYQDANVKNLDTNKQTIWYENKTNIHVEWIVVPNSEIATMFNLSIASQDYPDIYWNYGFTPTQVVTNGESGVFIPLNDLIETQGFYYRKALEENQNYREYLTAPDGNIYTFLSDDLGNHMMTQEKMFVYKPWLDKLGIDIPTTTVEFKEMLEAFKDNDMNGNGNPNDEIPLVGSVDGWSANPALFLLNPFQLFPQDKYGLVLEDGRITVAFTTEGFREGIRYIKSLYDEGLLAEETFVQDQTQLKAMISKPNSAEMIVGATPACWQGVFVDVNTMTTQGYIDYTPILPLKGPTGLQQTAVRNKIFRLYGAITSACKYPEAAFKWMDYYLGFDGTLLSSRGWDGVQYTWVDKPSIMGTTPSYTRILEGLQDHNDFWYATIFYDSEARRYGETWTPTGSGTILYEASIQYLQYAAGDGWPSIIWGTEADNDEISMLEVDIQSYVKQSITQFIIGSASIDSDWDAYLANLDAMGLQQYVDLLQAQIDVQVK